MPYRASIYFVLIILLVGSLPFNAQTQRTFEPPSTQGQRLSLSTKRVDHPDGKVVDSLTGRFQKSGKTLILSGYIVKKGLRPRRIVRRNQNSSSVAMLSKVRFTNNSSNSPTTQDPPEIAPEEPYDPGYNYYYAFSSITQPDGTVLAQAVYENQNSTGQNSLYLTVGGVTVASNLITEEATPLSPADEAQLEVWSTSQDADMVRDASTAIIEDGPGQSPSQLLLNYYALAMFVDTPPTTASGPRLTRSQKGSLHHAVNNLRTPIKRVETPCRDPKIVPFLTTRTSIAMMGTPALRALITPQCFGCCGIRCACIWDKHGATIIASACFDHDACVNEFGYTARQCMGKFIKAVLFVWWRHM